MTKHVLRGTVGRKEDLNRTTISTEEDKQEPSTEDLLGRDEGR